jgi:hypothetical protein
MLEGVAGKKLTYMPYKGGGEVAVQLVGNHVTSTVNNPIEAESHWRAGKLRAVGVALGVMALLFATFEIWFKVPLPKVPIEALFGL